MTITTTAATAAPPGRSTPRSKGPSHANSGYLFVLPFLLVFLTMLVLQVAYYRLVWRKQRIRKLI